MQVAFRTFSAMYKCVFCCRRCIRRYIEEEQPNTLSIRIPPTKVPWLWVGVRMRDGSTVTLTEQVNNSIGVGYVVDSHFISQLAGINPLLVQKYVYLDTKTLEEKEFPTDGVTIEDDSE